MRLIVSVLSQRRSVVGGALGMLMIAAVTLLGVASASPARVHARAAGTVARVLRVGSYHGIRGQFTSIQAAVDAARPGDWVLVGPGDYHETGNRVPPGANGDDRAGAAVLIRTAGLHLRGMDRNGVVIDGSKPGRPRCSANPADQDFGPIDPAGQPSGRNGAIVFKADGASMENFTACNFLTGDQGGGNNIWFDGGGATGAQKLGRWRGAFLSGTTGYFKDDNSPFSNYGIYASNTFGPGLYTEVYANNQADAAFYIGACPDCNTTLDHAHGENSDLGYSGTNSGGHLTVQNSEFDNNQSGFVTNSQNNDDYPSPQDGACPAGSSRPRPPGTQSSGSCWVFTHNSVHDNNNPNVPASGSAAAGPVGSGVVIAGGRNNIVTSNHVFNNKAWGVLLVPYPDTESPPPEANPACVGGTPPNQPNPPAGQNPNGDPCYFDDFGNEIAGNTIEHNGGFGNQSNVDMAEISNPNPNGNCWHGNHRGDGSEPSSDPPNIQATHATCGRPNAGDPAASPLGVQVICDSQFFTGTAPVPGPAPGGIDLGCPLPQQAANYPRATPGFKLMGLPAQRSMPDPCLDVPRNPWCPHNPVDPAAYPVPGVPFGAASPGARARIRLTASPSRASTGASHRYCFAATTVVGGRRHAVAGARIGFASSHAQTNRHGVACFVKRLHSPGRYRASASKTGLRSGTTYVRLVRARATPRFTG